MLVAQLQGTGVLKLFLKCDSGAHLGIHSADVTSAIVFRFKLAGYEWSDPVLSEDGVHSCRVRGAQGSLMLSLEVFQCIIRNHG